MIRRLEQLAALVGAGGLAIVRYWLFFRWFQGGGSDRRPPSSPSSAVPAELRSQRSLPGVETVGLPVEGAEIRARLSP